jgi:hydrogenase maturation protease
MDQGKTVIVGVGNILWRDEGVGVHVLSELEKRYKFPPDVVMVDGGTGGIVWLPLVLEAKRLIIIDCADFGGTPGEIRRFSFADISSGVSFSSTHGMKVAEVLELARSIGSLPDTVIFGIQPANWQEAGEGLSAEISRFLPDYLKSVISELGSYGIEIKDRE